MNVLDVKELDNGVVLTSYDDSKSIVGDRWHIRIRFVVVAPWDKWMDDLLEDAGVDHASVQNSEGELSLELIKERIFVDEAHKEEVMAEVIAEMHRNILTYLALPSFIEKFVRKRLSEVREQLSLPDVSCSDDTDIDDDGPADFSDCFR